MSAKNSLKGYTYQVNALICFVLKMDLKRDIKKIESEAEVKHNFDDMIILDKNNNTFCFQVKNYEKFDINNVKIEDEVVKIVAGNTKSDSEFDSRFINGLIVNKDFECDSEILGFKSKLIEGIHIIPITKNNYNNQVGNHIDVSRVEHIENQVINKISNSIFEFSIEELPKLSLFSNDLKHTTIKFNKLPEILNELSWHLGAPGTGKSHLVKEIEDSNENAKVYMFYADEHNQKRLEFDNFLEDFTQRIFGTPEKKSYEELVNKIIEDDLLVIIDGLDHVYNYQPLDLDKFLEFFDLLKNTKTLIFSRPFPEIINKDNVFNISIWNKKDTLKYLNQYKFDDDINEKIYELTEGYPIITYYLSEHYKQHGDLLKYSSKIESINDYYKSILTDIKIKKPLDLFLFCNSYILESEIKELLHQNDSENLLEFIEIYPYLFTKELNRLHLFHDSFFTFLKEESKMDYEYPIEKVKESILSKNINYLSRFKSFDFNDDFVKEVLKLYSNFDTFKELSKNFDFESVKLFYISLKEVLPKYKSVLDIYQYYSIILITMIVERQDYHHVPELFYNIFYYFDRNNIDEKNIFSNGVLWGLYLYYKTNDLYLYKKQLENEFYDTKRLIEDLDDKWCWENQWSFDYKNINLDETEIKEYLIETHEHTIFEKYLAYIYIKDIKESEYYTLIYNYVNNTFKNHHEDYFNDVFNEFGFIEYFKKDILKNAKIKIYERGYLKYENIFLNHDLTDFMKNIPPNLSCDVYPYLISYMRLYNNLNKNFNFEEIFKYLNMYYFRKDYSVINLEKALLIFEKYNCINECDSVRLIKNTMIKSEKGIESLLDNYLNKKSPKFMLNINQYWDKLEIYINELNYDKINYIKMEHITRDLRYVLSSCIEYNSIKELLKSKYGNQIISIVKLKNMTIKNVPISSIQFFEKNDINFEVMEPTNDEEDEERNYLMKTDLKKIQERKVDYLKLSSYIDGFNYCLPFIEFFEMYDSKKLKKDCLKIIHNAISTKERYFNKYPAIWYLCLGNIPYLLDMVEYDVDWDKLFNILLTYLEQSSIYLKKDKI